MSYIPTSLEPGERLICHSSTSKLAWLNSLIIAVALLAAMFSFGGLGKLRNKSELTLTNKRIIGKSGAAFGSTSLPLNKVERVAVKRSLLGILMRYGNVTITDMNGEKYIFRNIAQPALFKREADEAIEVTVLGRKLADFDKPEPALISADAPKTVSPPAPQPAMFIPPSAQDNSAARKSRIDPDQW